jgi:hypothetical protein
VATILRFPARRPRIITIRPGEMVIPGPMLRRASLPTSRFDLAAKVIGFLLGLGLGALVAWTLCHALLELVR